MTGFETVLPLTLDKAAARRERARLWREKNKEKLQDYFRARHAAAPEKKREAVKQWRKDNPEKVRAARARYRRKHSAERAKWLREWRKKNNISHRGAHLMRTFGITEETYLDMLEAQGGVCMICECAETRTMKGTSISMAVDHCHITGNIRGLLCADCNKGIGLLLDSPALLLRALEYLDRDVA